MNDRQTIPITHNILITLTQASAGNRVILWDSAISAKTSAILAAAGDVEYSYRNVFIKSLEVSYELPSLTEATFPANITPATSKLDRALAMRDMQWKGPRKEVHLFKSLDKTNWHRRGKLSLVQVTPTPEMNVLPYLSRQAVDENPDGIAVAAQVINVGTGFLGTNDFVTFGGSVQEDLIVLGRSKISASTSFSWIVGDTPKLILPANDKRKYAAIQNFGDKPLFLSFGNPPTTGGAGIFLNPKGGTKEIPIDEPMLQAIYGICNPGETTVATGVEWV